jgi:hypothetical protein
MNWKAQMMSRPYAHALLILLAALIAGRSNPARADEAGAQASDRALLAGTPQQLLTLRYTSAYVRLRRLGYEPLRLVPRTAESPCDNGNVDAKRCAASPELASCSNHGECLYYWRRRADGRLLIVGTVDSDTHGDVVDAVNWGERSRLCDYRFPPHLKLETLAPPQQHGDPCA